MSEEKINNENNNKKKWIIAGSILGVAAITTAIVVPVVLLTGGSSNLKPFSTNMQIEQSIKMDMSDNSKVKKGSIYNGVIFPDTPLEEELIIPEDDINMKDEIDEWLSEDWNDWDSVSFDSLLMEVVLLENIEINSIMYTPIAITYGISNLNLSSDSETLSLETYLSSFFELNKTVELGSGIEVLYKGGSVNDDSFTGEENNDSGETSFKDIENFYFDFLELENINYVDKINSDNNYSSNYDYYSSGFIYSSSSYVSDYFFEISSDTINDKEYGDIESIFFNFESGSNGLNIEIGPNMFNVWTF